MRATRGQCVLVMIATGLPLLLYPVVLIYNLFVLLSMGSAHIEFIPLLLAWSYLATSTLYPGVYLYTFVQAIPELTAGDSEAAMGWQVVNVYYLLIVVALLFGVFLTASLGA